MFRPLELYPGQPPQFGGNRLGRKQFVVATIENVFDMLLQMNFHLSFGLGFAAALSSHLKLKQKAHKITKRNLAGVFISLNREYHLPQSHMG